MCLMFLSLEWRDAMMSKEAGKTEVHEEGKECPLGERGKGEAKI